MNRSQGDYQLGKPTSLSPSMYLSQSEIIEERIKEMVLNATKHKAHLRKLAYSIEVLVYHARKQSQVSNAETDGAFTENCRCLPRFLAKIKNYIVAHNSRNRVFGYLLHQSDLRKIRRYQEEVRNRLLGLSIEGTRITAEAISDLITSNAQNIESEASTPTYVPQPDHASSTLPDTTFTTYAPVSLSPSSSNLGVTVGSSLTDANVSNSTFNGVGRNQFNHNHTRYIARVENSRIVNITDSIVILNQV
ncbi:hypothetical protein VKT23_018712 [Stygiomarasmius scandens]|uniref:Uncharacterized protein n=1 Tax=Marasmiellus scandens TaxID=2682957 RepID=A0ABR1IRG3_9AGAR